MWHQDTKKGNIYFAIQWIGWQANFSSQTALNIISRGPFHYSNSIEILYCSHLNSNNDCCKILQMTRLCCHGMCENLLQFDASNWIRARLSSRRISIVRKPHQMGPRQHPNLKMDMDGTCWHTIFKRAAGTWNAWFAYMLTGWCQKAV